MFTESKLRRFADNPLTFAAVLLGLAAVLAAPAALRAGPPLGPILEPCPEPPARMPYADPCDGEGIELVPGLTPGQTTEAPPENKGAGEGPPAPVVSIHVRVLANAVAGKDLEYHIDVDNRSTAAAHHVLVRDPLPANVRLVKADPEPSAKSPELQWKLGTLAAGAHKEIVLVVTPTGEGDVDNCARVQFEHGQCVRTHVTKPVVSVRKTGPEKALLFDSLKFQLTVANTGTAAASAVKLNDTLAPGLEHASGKSTLTWDIGTLEPGQTRVVDYQVIARTPGKLCNQAVVTAEGGFTARTETCVLVTEAKMSLAMHGPSRRYVNLPAAYHITVNNTGTAPLANVQVVNPLPEHLALVSAGAGQLASNQVTWAVGALEPGATKTLDLVLRAQVEGRFCNHATATAEHKLSAQAESCTDFKGISALLTELIDTEDPVEVGTETTYVVSVTNQGSVPATHLKIVAEVPAEEAVIRATGPVDNRKEGAKLIFEAATLKPQETARYTIYVKALQPKDVRFKVDVTADQLTGGPVHEEESTTLYTDLPASGRPPVEGITRSRRAARR